MEPHTRTDARTHSSPPGRAAIREKKKKKKGVFLRSHYTALFRIIYLRKHAENLPSIAYPLMRLARVRTSI